MVNLHRVARTAEVVVILVLGSYAYMTYRELSALRKFPVSLPSYEFEVSGNGDADRVVNTRGTWITERGTPEQILTTTIECRKAKMECVESAARVVFVSGKGLLESQQAAFAVDSWGEAEILTKANQEPCASRELVFDLRQKRALSRVGKSEEKGLCKELPARTLELVTGYRVRAAPE